MCSRYVSNLRFNNSKLDYLFKNKKKIEEKKKNSLISYEEATSY